MTAGKVLASLFFSREGNALPYRSGDAAPHLHIRDAWSRVIQKPREQFVEMMRPGFAPRGVTAAVVKA